MIKSHCSSFLHCIRRNNRCRYDDEHRFHCRTIRSRKILCLPSYFPYNVAIDRLVEQGVSKLFYISQIFERGSPAQKKLVVGSIYPENFTFDGFLVRTARVNVAARLIYELGVGFSENKKGQSAEISALSFYAEHFTIVIGDLKLVVDIRP